MIKPFRIDVPDETLNQILSRVRCFPWNAMADLDGWEYGANLAYMKELCAYWLEEFDWRKQETAINQLNH
ncbi:MAG: epoxide hydrolase N-terminal domain-containing protein, partial [Rhodospirillaceae bacterium]|nr:epoxide hydrolase N-terminal domain-containing protein [Rhodospirillaceae bacterium]